MSKPGPLAAGLIIIIVIFSVISCGKISEKKETEDAKSSAKAVHENIQIAKPLSFQELQGHWRLLYGNKYGYDFRFYQNYRSVVILYLGNYSLIFKGVYTLEDENSIRINIYEMKREKRVSPVNIRNGFVKATSSHFIFNAQNKKINNRMHLVLRPHTIIIDGNNSDGYFEPVIRLKKI